MISAIYSLPLRKSSGPDSISSEHLIFAATSCALLLCQLFNGILALGMVPSAFCKSLIVPIFKGQGKDPIDPSNYRGISLTSTVSKLFERVIAPRFLECLLPLLHPLQGGFRPGFSTLHSSYILQEAILECRSHQKKAFVALLDVRKAFDTVWHDGLLFKLYEAGVPGV